MPSFDKAKKSPRGNNGNGSKFPARITDTQVTEPRCHVCSHPKRSLIDRYLARGDSFSELSRVFGIDRRGLSNHYRNHLNLEDAAIAAIIEREAVLLNEDFQEGVRGILARRVYLETALKKAQEALLNNEVVPDARDTVAIIEKLDKMESETTEAAITEMRIELAAYIQAMKENVPSDLWDTIFIRTKDLAERAKSTAQLKSGD